MKLRTSIRKLKESKVFVPEEESISRKVYMTKEELKEQIAEYGCLHSEGCACMDEDNPDECNCRPVNNLMSLIDQYIDSLIGEDDSIDGKCPGCKKDGIERLGQVHHRNTEEHANFLNQFRAELRRKAGIE